MRLYELARELGVSSKDLMSRLAEKGVAINNHLAALSKQDEDLARSLFSAGGNGDSAPAAPPKAKPRKARRRRKTEPAVVAPAEAPPDELSAKVAGVEKRVDDLALLCKEIAEILRRSRDKLQQLRESLHKRTAAQAQPAPQTQVPAAVAEEQPQQVEAKPAEEEKAPREAAKIESAAAATETAPPPVEEKERKAAAEKDRREAAETPPAEAPPKKAPPPKEPRKPRRVISVTDRLGGPKPLITKPATPLSRPPARQAERRRAGAERVREAGRVAEPEPGAPPKPGLRRGQKGKVRFFPKDYEEETWKEEKVPVLRYPKPKQPQAVPVKRPEKVVVSLPVTVKEFSVKSGIRQADIIKFFLLRKQVVNANSHLDEDALETLAIEFNIDLEIRKGKDLEAPLKEIEERKDPPELLRPRRPVVTLLGHVDHGKTSILDYIRHTNVHEREHGGITQHISAYQIEQPYPITFVDTPGHAAFTRMRARGANVTDIAVLVVAADDGPMPQTEEAISHIKAAGVGLIVAINKIDLPTANPLRTKQRLSELGLLPRDWGGETEMVEVSALTGQGINDLLETIHLMGEVMELRANPEREAIGTVLEARSSPGRGIIATVLVQNGTLRVGDYALCGTAHGRVRGLWSTTTGKPVKEAGPATPVDVMGLCRVPEAGDRFYVLRDPELAEAIAERRYQQLREEERAQREQKITLENLFERIKESEDKELRLVLKADTKGSVEALSGQLAGLGTDEVSVKILHAAVGMVSENDVVLAEASKAIVLAFNVPTDERARNVAEERGVQIRSYNVIYNLLDDVKSALEDRLSPIYEEEIRGHAEVRQIFRSSRIGNIAGCVVLDGTVGRNDQVRVKRDGEVVHTGEIGSLRRGKEDVKEVREGFECGIKIADFDDIREGDILECFRVVAKRRTL